MIKPLPLNPAHDTKRTKRHRATICSGLFVNVLIPVRKKKQYPVLYFFTSSGLSPFAARLPPIRSRPSPPPSVREREPDPGIRLNRFRFGPDRFEHCGPAGLFYSVTIAVNRFKEKPIFHIPTTKIRKNKKKSVTLRSYFYGLKVNDSVKTGPDLKLIYL